jgi:hypothetical protein
MALNEKRRKFYPLSVLSTKYISSSSESYQSHWSSEVNESEFSCESEVRFSSADINASRI